MPLIPLENSTPYERLYGTKPSYELLKVFRCLCFASTLKRDRTKLDARADPCIFIGYSQQQKGYRLYNLKTKTTFISRDVCFHERCFPYRFSNSNQTPMKHLVILRSNYNTNATDPENVVPTEQHTSQHSDQAEPSVSSEHQPSTKYLN